MGSRGVWKLVGVLAVVAAVSFVAGYFAVSGFVT